MTREEARGLLMRCEAESYCPHYLQKFNCDGCKQRIALDMAIEALANLKSEFESAEYEDYEHATLVDIKEPLKVLVVRCKDCKYADFKSPYPVCNLIEMNITYNDFCSWGERREEE